MPGRVFAGGGARAGLGDVDLAAGPGAHAAAADADQAGNPGIAVAARAAAAADALGEDPIGAVEPGGDVAGVEDGDLFAVAAVAGVAADADREVLGEARLALAGQAEDETAAGEEADIAVAAIAAAAAQALGDDAGGVRAEGQYVPDI